MYPVSSVMTSPGDTICLGSNPAKAEILFLFFGNLASTDIFYSAKMTDTHEAQNSAAILTVGDWATLSEQR